VLSSVQKRLCTNSQKTGERMYACCYHDALRKRQFIAESGNAEGYRAGETRLEQFWVLKKDKQTSNTESRNSKKRKKLF